MFGAFAPHAKAWATAFKPAREAAGGKVVAEHTMSCNRATDFYSGVSSMLAAKYADDRWRAASKALT